MFVLQPKATFKTEIAIPVPGGAEGKITFEFKHKGKKDLRVFFDSLTAEDAREDADALAELVVGWSGVDVPFSKENLATLLDNYPSAAISLLRGYQTALLEGRAKN